MEVSIEVGGRFYASRWNASRWTLMGVLWKKLDVCHIRGSKWKYLAVYGKWKLIETSAECIHRS